MELDRRVIAYSTKDIRKRFQRLIVFVALDQVTILPPPPEAVKFLKITATGDGASTNFVPCRFSNFDMSSRLPSVVFAVVRSYRFVNR